jgi:hypothetical protein
VAQAESTSRRADQKALYVHRSSASAQDAGSWQHRIKARSELSAGATLDCQGLRCRRQHDRRRGRVPDSAARFSPAVNFWKKLPENRGWQIAIS